eukprot:gene60161-80236_t
MQQVFRALADPCAMRNCTTLRKPSVSHSAFGFVQARPRGNLSGCPCDRTVARERSSSLAAGGDRGYDRCVILDGSESPCRGHDDPCPDFDHLSLRE